MVCLFHLAVKFGVVAGLYEALPDTECKLNTQVIHYVFWDAIVLEHMLNTISAVLMADGKPSRVIGHKDFENWSTTTMMKVLKWRKVGYEIYGKV